VGIIFKVITENKSDLINILIEILKQADKRGVQIYEEDKCMSYEGKYGQSRNIKSRTSNK
jgi:flagellar motor component MotA